MLAVGLTVPVFVALFVFLVARTKRQEHSVQSHEPPQSTLGAVAPWLHDAEQAPSPHATVVSTQASSSHSTEHGPLPQVIGTVPHASTPPVHWTSHAFSAGQWIVASSHASGPSQITTHANSSGHTIAAPSLDAEVELGLHQEDPAHVSPPTPRAAKPRAAPPCRFPATMSSLGGQAVAPPVGLARPAAGLGAFDHDWTRRPATLRADGDSVEAMSDGLSRVPLSAAAIAVLEEYGARWIPPLADDALPGRFASRGYPLHDAALAFERAIGGLEFEDHDGGSWLIGAAACVGSDAHVHPCGGAEQADLQLVPVVYTPDDGIGYVDREGAGWFHDTIEQRSASRVADTAATMIELLVVGDSE